MRHPVRSEYFKGTCGRLAAVTSLRHQRIQFVLILGGASLPFLAKIGVLLFGVTGYLLQSLYKIFQLIIPCLWRYREGKRRMSILWPTDAPLPSLRLLGIATLVAVVLAGSAVAALQWIIPVWELDPAVIRAGFDARFAMGPLGAMTVVIFLSFANSALEELHFRAWLDRELSRIAGAPVGIGVSAAAFGCMHGLIFLGLPSFPPALVAAAVVGLMIAGACWSLLVRQSGGIHAAWWSHGLSDALLLGWGLYWLGYV